MINVNRLVLRRDRPDGVSQHTSTFRWPESGFVGVRPNERVGLHGGCGPGLYGYSCAPGRAQRMTLDWTGPVWRLVLAISDPIDLGNKCKYEAGHVLYAGTAQECRDVILGLGGEVPTACLGVDPEARRPGFDVLAIVADIVAGSDRRAADAGLWRVFRAISMGGSYDVWRERQIREWIAVGIPAGDAHYMSGVASPGAAAAWHAGWRHAHDRHDIQVLALAGWSASRTAWLDDPTAPAIREWLLAHPTATEQELRDAALALERLPERLADAESLYDARRAYATADGEVLRAIALARKHPKVGTRSRDRSVAVYYGTIRAIAPNGWIDPGVIARMRNPPAVVRWDWCSEANKIKIKIEKARLRESKRQTRESRKIAQLVGKVARERARLMDLITIKNGPKSWGRVTRWAVEHVSGGPSEWVYSHPGNLDLDQLLALVQRRALAAVGHV